MPNREGVDPHGPDASEQVTGRQQISEFLKPNGVFIDVCAPKPCYLGGLDRPVAGQPKAASSEDVDGTGSGRRIMRNELNRPMSAARSGIRSAT